MKRVMLDLETLDSGSNAAILSIGAQIFDLEEASLGATFYQPVDAEHSVKYFSRVKSADTMAWWAKQVPEARAVFDEPKLILPLALSDFTEWFSREAGTSAEIWGNGSDFDNVILSNAFHAVRMKQPWSHRSSRCYRTLCALVPGPVVWPVRRGTHHNALDDATFQAECALVAYAEIRRAERERL